MCDRLLAHGPYTTRGVAAHPAMTEREPPSSLDDIDARLRKAREKADQAAGKGRHGGNARSGIGFAFRIGVELVASLIVGGGIGLLLDRWLGTGPWLMVVFFLLGAGAGFLNVYRVMAGMGQSVGYPRDGDDTGNAAGPDRP